MATRERKAKMNAESPTPSAGSESTPTTPTTNATVGGAKGGRKGASGASVAATGRMRSTRGASAQQVAEEGEPEKEKDKAEESAEGANETETKVKTPRTPRVSRATMVAQKAAEAKAAETKAAEAKVVETKASDVKETEAKVAPEESKEETSKDDDEKSEVSGEEATDEEPRKNASSSPATVKKSRTPTSGRGGRGRKRMGAQGVGRPRGIMKRKTLPAAAARSNAARMVTRRNSIAKIEAIAKALKEDITPIRKSTRTRRKTKIANEEPVKRKRRRMMSEHDKVEETPKEDAEMKQPEKVAKSEVVSDSELIRRRSDSVSKYSDTTDNSSFYDAGMAKGAEEWGRDSNATPKVDTESEEAKVENTELEEEQSAAETKPTAEESDSAQKPKRTNLVRRSGRARKGTQKEKEVEATATKAAKVAENKTDGQDSVMNPAEDTDVDGAKGALLHVETTAAKVPSVVEEDTKDSEEVEEKKGEASSLSPELVSEGVSPISVQQFYGQPAFLENNLGIEEDPKLREIVQVKEKIKKVEDNEVPDEKKEIKEEKAEDTATENVKEEKDKEDIEMENVVNGTNEIEVVDVAVKAEESSVEKEITETVSEEKKEDSQEETPESNEEEVKKSDEEISIAPVQENTDSNEACEEQNEVNDKENVASNGENVQSPEKCEEMQNSVGSPKSPSVPESPETRLKKESHLKSLGLLTHEAAVEAKIEKARRREFFKSAANNSSLSSASSTSSGSSVSSQTSNGTKNGKPGRPPSNPEYTGTLKTVIKLHRPQTQEKRKTRMPLKMTFQKGRVKSANSGNDKDQVNMSNSDEDTYYTIQNEADGANADIVHGGISRKTHYRSHTGESAATVTAPTEPSKEVQKALVIPEKASSFSIHPGRLCQDQCFYCGGKFGLFDTPCHVAQIKSLERQKKILDNEEKLTVDNCLCDACYRHVDRRANCPSYRSKRQSSAFMAEKQERVADSIRHDSEEVRSTTLCLVTGCTEVSSHLLRRKWFAKMRKPINKLIRLNVDVSNAHGLGQVPICQKHYDIISHLMVCILCKRKLPRNHIFYINQEIKRLDHLIKKQGIPVSLGTNAVVCKLCRYYTNLLLKPPDRKTQRAQFVRSYRRRLLSFHNVDLLDASDDKEGDQRVQQKDRSGGRSADEELDNDQEMSDHNDTSQNTSGGQILLDNDVMVDYDVPMLDSGPYAGAKVKQQKMQSLLLPRSQQMREKQQQRLQQMQNDSEVSRLLRDNPNISMRELFPGEDELGLQVYLPFGQGGHRTPEGWTRTASILQYDDATKQLWEELQKPYGNQSSFIRHLVLLEKYFRNGDLILSPTASSSAVTYSESVQNRLKSFDNVTSDSLSIFHQLSNAPITITPANPKGRGGTSTGRYSEMGASTSLLKSNNTRHEASVDGFKGPEGVSIIKKSSGSGVPPDLISITTTPAHKPPSGGIDTITVTATGSQKGTSPPVTVTTPSPPPSSAPAVGSKDIVIKLPEALSSAERRLVNGKAWRPTLMPIAPLERDSARDGVNTLYQTADGRLLPSRVQVMSGGKPYHISIYDYNRMCILRREKILQKAMAAQGKSPPENGQRKSPPSTSQSQHFVPTASTSKAKVQIPNKILEQNSVLPISGRTGGGASSELQSLIKVRKPNPTSLLKNQIPIAPKPPPAQQQQPPISAIVSMSTNTMPNTNPMMSIIDLMKNTTTPTAPTNMWLFNESVNGPQGADNSAASLLSKIPKSLTVIPQQKGRSGSRVSSGEDQSSA